MTYKGYKNKEKRKEYLKLKMRDYRAAKKAELKQLQQKITELKRLASQPITQMTSLELIEKIKRL